MNNNEHMHVIIMAAGLVYTFYCVWLKLSSVSERMIRAIFYGR